MGPSSALSVTTLLSFLFRNWRLNSRAFLALLPRPELPRLWALPATVATTELNGYCLKSNMYALPLEALLWDRGNRAPRADLRVRTRGGRACEAVLRMCAQKALPEVEGKPTGQVWAGVSQACVRSRLF